jgi:hypothetical protein
MKDRSGAEGFIQHAAKMKLFTFSTIVLRIDAGRAIDPGREKRRSTMGRGRIPGDRGMG